MRTAPRKALGLLAALAVLLGLMSLLPTAAHAQGDPVSCEAVIADYEGSAIITVDPVSVTPGGTVVLTGVGFPPNAVVPLYFNDQLIGEPVTDADGNFSFNYTVPADIASGTFEFSAACGTFILTASITITPITPTPVPTTPTPLPITGSDSTVNMAQVALTLLAIGGVLVVVARRSSRRRELVGS